MKITTTLLALCIITASTITIAQPKPEDQIKFRQSGMMFMRWNMGIIKSQVIKNPQSYNKESVIKSANTIAAIANSGIESLFNTESATGKGWKDTLVKPEYFEQREEVEKYIKSFTEQANKLVTTANTGNPGLIKKQFAELLDACKACHKKFRSKKK